MRRSALLVIALLTAVTACGASIQAVYEGDVRFEHCMALDSRPDAKATLQSACWAEWVKFYTFGQTRDRVEYAKLRQKQLSTSSDFDEGEYAAQNARAASAVPEPTSVLEPPPMTLASDGGGAPPPEVADAGADAGADAAAPPPPGAACSSECDESWTFCRKECKSAACEKSCAATHKRCMRKCF
jgi:hypothetical protein